MDFLLQSVDLVFNGQIKYPNVQIERGAISFVVGKSGSGKSSLLKMFNRTLPISSGLILYQGQDISTFESIKLRREMALVSQDIFLFPGSIEDNFNSFYEYRKDAQLNRETAAEWLDLCQIKFPWNKRVESMSGGERQRLYLAIFISFQPKVLLLDEPTSNLDSGTGLAVMTNIIKFCRDKKIELIVVSHDEDLTDRCAERKIILPSEES